jgi:hypothetical protein
VRGSAAEPFSGVCRRGAPSPRKSGMRRRTALVSWQSSGSTAPSFRLSGARFTTREGETCPPGPIASQGAGRRDYIRDVARQTTRPQRWSALLHAPRDKLVARRIADIGGVGVGDRRPRSPVCTRARPAPRRRTASPPIGRSPG